MHRLVVQMREAASTVRLCHLLAISRSGYYAARRRQAQPVADCPVSARLKAAFAQSQQSYGSRRLQVVLCRDGLKIGRYRVRTLMKRQQLRPVWKRRFVHTTHSRHSLPSAQNVLDRQFNPAAPNQAWTSDITYIRTQRGWLYLAVVMDLFSRKIIGWAMAPSMPTTLVTTALEMALAQRGPTTGLLIHSDQGSQYASESYRALLRRHGLRASMSRKGNCWDNAVMERFFLNLKMERVWRRSYANASEATADIADYIVGFYNACRLHSTLGYVSPNAFEASPATN
jgi:putative transposase